MKPSLNLKMSSSHVPAQFAKSRHLATQPQRKLHFSASKKNQLQDLQSESKVSRKISSEGLNLNEDENNTKFGDISAIEIKENENSRDESWTEVDRMLGSPVHKRDLNNFLKVSLKYGVKVPKTLMTSPVRQFKKSLLTIHPSIKSIS